MIRAQLEFTGPSAMVWDQLPAVFVLRPEVGEMFVGRDCRGGLILNSSEQPNMISRQHAMLCWNESDGLWTVHRQLFLTGRVISGGEQGYCLPTLCAEHAVRLVLLPDTPHTRCGT